MSRASSRPGRARRSSFSTCAASRRSPAPAGRLLAEGFRELAAFNVTAILSGIKRSSAEWQAIGEWTEGISNLRNFRLLDDAIEWAEDQIVYRHGGAIEAHEMTELSEQALLAGLTREGTRPISPRWAPIRSYDAGTTIIAASEPAVSLFFLRSGVVHVRLPGGIRLATLTAGMAFGEMALLEAHRSADVLADKSVTALEVPLADFQRFREQNPRIGERIMRNLAQLLADRLIVANTKVSLLTANYGGRLARPSLLEMLQIPASNGDIMHLVLTCYNR